jgi:hypothetical protein
MPIGNALSVIRRFRPFPPVITSAGTINAVLNQAGFDYQITATNDPTSFGATPIPAGLGINIVTGHLTGTPTALNVAGTNVTVSAKNQTGTGTKVLTIRILPPPPVITSALTLNGFVNTALTYNIVATNMLAAYTPSYGASDLPPGLTVNTTSGLINGTPTTIGTYNAVISAKNSGGSDFKTLVIDIQLGPPVITQPPNVTKAVNTSFSYQIGATNSPTAYTATGLPTGLSVDASGLISGTLPNLTTNQTYTVTVNASNSTGSGIAKSFTISIVALPVVTANNFGSDTGTQATTTATATNGPVTWSLSNVTGLLAGASIDSSGRITGIANSTVASNGNLTVNATNTAGTGSVTIQFFVFIPPPPPTPPTITSSTLTFSVKKGTNLNYQIAATGTTPFTFSCTGLASGWSCNKNTGLISGVCNTQGIGTWTMTVTNSQGSDSKNVGWGVSP